MSCNATDIFLFFFLQLTSSISVKSIDKISPVILLLPIKYNVSDLLSINN